MKNSKRNSIFAICMAVILVFGFATARYFNTTEAQSAKKEIAWKHKEKPLKKANSKFKLKLPIFSENADWLVAVKPIAPGEKEKMYIGVFTYSEEEGTKAKEMGFKELSQIEDYQQDLVKSVDGEDSLTGLINPDQTLVVYLEVDPSTKTVFEQNGKEFSVDASEGSYFIYNGTVEKAEVKSTASLIVKANLKQAEKDLAKRGITLKSGQEEK